MSLKSRIEALILQISNAKTSLRDALRNKGVDPGSQPSFEALRLGIERIPSGNNYEELIGKKTQISIRVNCNLDSIQSALDKINGSFHEGDLVVILTYTMPMGGNYGLCTYNLSKGTFSYFFGYGSANIQDGYPCVVIVLFLESVSITSVNTGRYDISFTGYTLKVGKSQVD